MEPPGAWGTAAAGDRRGPARPYPRATGAGHRPGGAAVPVTPCAPPPGRSFCRRFPAGLRGALDRSPRFPGPLGPAWMPAPSGGHMMTPRRLTYPATFLLALGVLAAGCAKKNQTASTGTSSDSLLASSPVEQPQGQVQP